VESSILILAIALVMPAATPYAALVVRRAPRLVYGTDFENITKQSANTLNMGINNWFEFGGNGGASIWMEGLDRKTPGITCHSGNRCVGMELTNITASRRNEFNIHGLQNLVGNEVFVSVWLYYPADFQMHLPVLSGHPRNWWALCDPFFTGSPSYQPYAEPHIMQDDGSTTAVFALDFDVRDINGNLMTLKIIPSFQLPRGRWFNLQYYVYHDATNGILRIWIDGVFVLQVTGIQTANPTIVEWFTTPAKIYYDLRDTFSPYRIWVDDLQIYNGQPV
jgi:hypothetical protein